MAKILLLLVALAVGFVLTIFLASEFGGEVVVLHTHDQAGAERTTSLWVVDRQGFQYLRAGDGGSAWLERLRQKPEVDVERAGETARYQAVPAPVALDAPEAGADRTGIDPEDPHASEASISFSSMSKFDQTFCTSSWSSSASISRTIDCAVLPSSFT